MEGAIDIHTHYAKAGHWKEWVKEWWEKMNSEDFWLVENYTPENLLRYMDEAQVEYAVVLAERAPNVTGDTPTETVIEFCKSSERLIPFANINPHLSNYPYKDMLKYIRMGAKGLKLHPVHMRFELTDRRLYPVYYICQEEGVPVMIHAGTSIFPGSKDKYGSPHYVNEIAEDFPDLVLIMSHGGRGFWYEDAQFIVRHRKNVYIDISGLPIKRLLDYFPRMEQLKNKFLFGTDWPGSSMKHSIEEFMKLPLSEEAKKLILRENALRILSPILKG